MLTMGVDVVCSHLLPVLLPLRWTISDEMEHMSIQAAGWSSVAGQDIRELAARVQSLRQNDAAHPVQARGPSSATRWLRCAERSCLSLCCSAARSACGSLPCCTMAARHGGAATCV